MNRRLRIAVNGRWLLTSGLDGTGWYTRALLERLTAQHPEVEWHVLVDRPSSASWDFLTNATVHVVPPPARHWTLWHLWNRAAVPSALNRIQPDVYWSPDGMLPRRGSVPLVGTVHDLGFVHRPQDLGRVLGAYYRWIYRSSVRQADALLTVSETTRTDVHRTYGYPLAQLHTAYNAPQRAFAPLSPEEAHSARARWTNGRPYFLAVGSFTPRKNLALLLEAFDRFKEKTGSNHELVLVGDSLHADPAFDKALKNTQHRSSVVFPGRAKSDALQSLLGAAEALCFPSFFEGFGIPLVEAFQAGTPVISSSASCMPEIVGDAGWLVDPHSATDWANALERMTALPLSERQSLVERGLRRAADFSWDRSAETVFNVLSRAASRS